MGMTMESYCAEMRHAVDGLLALIWDEYRQEDALHRLYHGQEATTGAGYQKAEALFLDAEDPDDVAMAVGVHWDTYFGPDRDRHFTAEDLSNIREEVRVHRFSVYSLSEALLQYAKQGIGIVHGIRHGDLSRVPDGRLVGGQPLKEVVWQARNQAQHWEEGALKKRVKTCFRLLASEVDSTFGDFEHRSMAFDVVRLLGWKSTDAFFTDMRSLG